MAIVVWQMDLAGISAIGHGYEKDGESKKWAESMAIMNSSH